MYHPGKDCWIAVPEWQWTRATNLPIWTKGNLTGCRYAQKLGIFTFAAFDFNNVKSRLLWKYISMWWMCVDVHVKFYFLLTHWRWWTYITWPKGRRCRIQAMMLQRPTCRPEGSVRYMWRLWKSGPRVKSFKRNYFRISKSPWFFKLRVLTAMVWFPRKSKDQTWEPTHSNIAENPSRGVFKELTRLGSIQSEATATWLILIDDLTSSSVWTPSAKIPGVSWRGLGSPTRRSKSVSLGFLRAVSCGMIGTTVNE